MQKKKIDEALKHLEKDAHLKHVVRKGPRPPVRRPGAPFASLVRSIIFQQLSGKAAGTILKRFLELFPKTDFPTPEQVLKLKDLQFRKAGVSGQKMSYLRDLAKRFLDGTIEPKKFSKMTDEEIREHLIVVKGIGRWTADMFLMFTLYRPDVLPTGDLGIQKGFQKVFSLKKMPSPVQMEKLAKSWEPHRTVASWYLWRVVDGEDADW
ncbi:MAG: DNA-3-methyladenine glycosylase [Minisyncoccia bacterium]